MGGEHGGHVMRKVVLLIAIAGCLLAPSVGRAAQREAAAAGLLSAVMPGTGEWYNNNWRGQFPWGECVVGSICFCFHLSSVIDAVNGNTDANMRFDFWTAPAVQK
jgi:hypothetical protein